MTANHMKCSASSGLMRAARTAGYSAAARVVVMTTSDAFTASPARRVG